MKRRLIGLCMALAALANVNAQTQEELWIKNGERNIYGVLSRPENGSGSAIPVGWKMANAYGCCKVYALWLEWNRNDERNVHR